MSNKYPVSDDNTKIAKETDGDTSMRNLLLGRLSALPAAVLMVVAIVSGRPAAATENVLYSFCSQTNCTDGASPAAGLIMDAAGNLYGTTYEGGQYGHGVVFELSSSSAGSTETVLHSFDNSDGAGPAAGLIMDAAGNLYGTTTAGGQYGSGVAFELSPSSTGWTETVLHSFNNSDGTYPYAGLIMDAAGDLYGTTYEGGNLACNAPYGCGVVFELTNTGSGWEENVLHSFDDSDGAYPQAALIMGEAGNLYGTTGKGGNAFGLVFELTKARSGWKEKVLFSFDQTDGFAPWAGVIMDTAGRLYGTTNSGGPNENGYGVVFRLSPSTAGWMETSLLNFNYIDGANPVAGLIMGAAGDLYGTTFAGGKASSGVVFRLSHSSTGWKATVLHSFCSQTNCADGEYPDAGVIMDTAGNLYGTTENGGNGQGVVFELTP
jgi:uncharacterized repeat protein (TIGR03803 family)